MDFGSIFMTGLLIGAGILIGIITVIVAIMLLPLALVVAGFGLLIGSVVLTGGMLVGAAFADPYPFWMPLAWFFGGIVSLCVGLALADAAS